MIRVEQTPNPKTMRFVLDRPLHDGDTMEVQRGQIGDVPVASMMFEDPRVESVMIGRNFLSVSAREDAWRPGLFAVLMEHIEAWVADGMPMGSGAHSGPDPEGDPELMPTDDLTIVVKAAVYPARTHVVPVQSIRTTTGPLPSLKDLHN